MPDDFNQQPVSDAPQGLSDDELLTQFDPSRNRPAGLPGAPVGLSDEDLLRSYMPSPPPPPSLGTARSRAMQPAFVVPAPQGLSDYDLLRTYFPAPPKPIQDIGTKLDSGEPSPSAVELAQRDGLGGPPDRAWNDPLGNEAPPALDTELPRQSEDIATRRAGLAPQQSWGLAAGNEAAQYVGNEASKAGVVVGGLLNQASDEADQIAQTPDPSGLRSFSGKILDAIEAPQKWFGSKLASIVSQSQTRAPTNFNTPGMANIAPGLVAAPAIGRLFGLDPETVAQAATMPGNTLGDKIINWADAARSLREQRYPVNPEMTGADPRNMGDVLGGIMVKGVGLGADLGAQALLAMGTRNPAVFPAAWAAGSYDTAYHDALQHKAPPKVAEQAALQSAATSYVLGSLGVGDMASFADASPGLMNWVKDTSFKMAKEAAVFGGLNGLSQVADNVIAQSLYDPNRPFGQDVADQVMQGLGQGAFMGAIHGALRASGAFPKPNNDWFQPPKPPGMSDAEWYDESENLVPPPNGQNGAPPPAPPPSGSPVGPKGPVGPAAPPSAETSNPLATPDVESGSTPYRVVWNEYVGKFDVVDLDGLIVSRHSSYEDAHNEASKLNLTSKVAAAPTVPPPSPAAEAATATLQNIAEGKAADAPRAAPDNVPSQNNVATPSPVTPTQSGHTVAYNPITGGVDVIDPSGNVVSNHEWPDVAKEEAKRLNALASTPPVTQTPAVSPLDDLQSLIDPATGRFHEPSAQTPPVATAAPFISPSLPANQSTHAPVQATPPSSADALLNQHIDQAAAQTPPAPSSAQIESGNYPKGKVEFDGIPIAIETPRGVARSGVDANGQPWNNTHPTAHYGEILGTHAADGDPLDVYIGPHPSSPHVFVVDQIDPATGRFDEAKAILGANDQAEATQIYDQGFSDGSGPRRRGAITQMDVPRFKEWIKNGDLTKPIGLPVQKFTTAKGSTYDVFSDGTTQRNKSDHTGSGHDADDVGVKPRSAKTVYVDDAMVGRELSAAGLQNMPPQGARVVIRDGKAALLIWNDQAGKWGISSSRAGIPVFNEPAVGRAPLELWKPKDDVPGYEAYSGMHLGNAITHLSPTIHATPPQKTGRVLGIRRKGQPPANILQFIAQQGGIQDDDGELKARDLHKPKFGFYSGFGNIVRKNGLPPDKMREKAEEAGWIRSKDRNATTGLNDLYEAIDTALDDRNRYLSQRTKDQIAEEHRARQEAEAIAFEKEMAPLRQRAEELGITVHPDMLPEDLKAEIDEREAIMSEPSISDVMADRIENETGRTAASTFPEASDDIPWFNEYPETETGDQPDPFAGSGETGTEAGPFGGPAPESKGARPVTESGTETSAESAGVPGQPRAPSVERTDQGDQLVIPGAEQSAVQLAASKEAQGRGKIQATAFQKPPDIGLFAPPIAPERQADLLNALDQAKKTALEDTPLPETDAAEAAIPKPDAEEDADLESRRGASEPDRYQVMENEDGTFSVIDRHLADRDNWQGDAWRVPGAHDELAAQHKADDLNAADRRTTGMVKTGPEPKRGAQAIVNRLRLQTALDEANAKRNPQSGVRPLSPDEANALNRFIDFIGHHMFGDVALRIRADKPGTPLGRYETASKIVTIFRKAIQSGNLTATAVHELWHSLERVLPPGDQDAVRSEFARQQQKWINKNKWAAPFLKPGRELRDALTGEAAREWYAAHGKNAHALPVVVDYAKDGKTPVAIRMAWNGETYRFKNASEYWAETMADKTFDRAQLDGEKARSIWGHIKAIWDRMVLGFQNLFGRNATGRIFEGFAKQEYAPGNRTDNDLALADGDGMLEQRVGTDGIGDGLEERKNYPDWLTSHVKSFAVAKPIYANDDVGLLRVSSAGNTPIHAAVDRASGKHTLVDINSYTGKMFTPEQLKTLRAAKARDVKAMEKGKDRTAELAPAYEAATTPAERMASADAFVRKLGAEAGYEWLVDHDPAIGKLHQAVTDFVPRQVRFGKELSKRLADPNNRLVLQHNHPNGTPLSQADIYQLRHPGAAWIVAHGPKGEFSAARVSDALRNSGIPGIASTDGARQGQVLDDAMDVAKTALHNHLIALADSGKMNPATAVAIPTEHYVGRILHNAGLIDYVGTHDEGDVSEGALRDLGNQVRKKVENEYSLKPYTLKRGNADRPSRVESAGEGIARISDQLGRADGSGRAGNQDLNPQSQAGHSLPAEDAGRQSVKPTDTKSLAQRFLEWRKPKDGLRESDDDAAGRADFARFLTDRAPKTERDIHQAAADYVMQRGRDTGNEHLVAIDRATNRLVSVNSSGEATRVGFSPELSMQGRHSQSAIIIHHNHLTPEALSGADIATLANRGIDTVIAHGSDGHMSAARLTPSVRAALIKKGADGSADALHHVYDAVRSCVEKDLLDAIMQKRIAAESAIDAEHEIINHAIQAAGVTDYTSTRNLSDMLEEKILKPTLMKASLVARAAAAKEGIPISGVSDVRLYRPASYVRVAQGLDRVLALAQSHAGTERPAGEGGNPEREKGNSTPQGLGSRSEDDGRSEASTEPSSKLEAANALAHRPAADVRDTEGYGRILGLTKGEVGSRYTFHANADQERGEGSGQKSEDVRGPENGENSEGRKPPTALEAPRDFNDAKGERTPPKSEWHGPLDNTSEAIGDVLKGASPSTYDRLLAKMTLNDAKQIKNVNPVEKLTIFPKTVAEMDTMFARLYNESQDRDRDQRVMLERWRGHIPTFLKLTDKERDRVYGAEELDRIYANERKNDGKPLEVYNTSRDTAHFTKPGDRYTLTPKETEAYFERRKMFADAWKSIMEGVAKRLGWDGPVDAAAIGRAAVEANHPQTQRRYLRIAEVVRMMADQARTAYVPFMRFGNEFISVTPKEGTKAADIAKWTGEGFPPTHWFDTVEREPFKEIIGKPHVPGKPTPEAMKRVAELRKRFPAEDGWRIETGDFHSKPDLLRKIDIPALEKLFMLMERNVSNDTIEKVMRDYEPPDGEAGDPDEAKEEIRARADALKDMKGDLVDTFLDALYQQLKAGFRKKARNVPGYSKDFDRATGAYMNWASHYAADQMHRVAMQEASQQIQDYHPHNSTKRYADEWERYQSDPASPLSRAARSTSQLGFAYTLALNPSSSLVFATHSLVHGLPMMSKGVGMGMAMRTLTRAMAQAYAKARINATDGAHINLTDFGDTPREKAFIKSLMADGSLRAVGSGDMEALSDRQAQLWGTMRSTMRKAFDIAISNISVVDQANRAATALALFRIAMHPDALKRMAEANQHYANFKDLVNRALEKARQDQFESDRGKPLALEDVLTPEMMARFALDEAAFTWGKINEPRVMRGFGRQMFSLHGFVTRFVSSIIKSITRSGSEGKIAALWMLSALWAGAGVNGLPFEEDLENAADWMWKTLFHEDPMIDAHIRSFLSDSGMGKIGAEMVMRGPLSELFGVDLGSRLGLGDLITREVEGAVNGAEMLSTAPAIIWGRIMAALKREHSHQGSVAAATELLPAGLRNPAKALEQAQTGIKSQKGYPIQSAKELSTADTIKRALGFTPLSTERAYERDAIRFRQKDDERNRIPYTGKSSIPDDSKPSP